MKGEQKQRLIALRRSGAGYGQIADALEISINTVKSFCRRHGLSSAAKPSVCEQCGRTIEQNPGRKRKRFCSVLCRNKWWNTHLDLVQRNSESTATAIGNSAPMPAISNTGLAVSVMDKRVFHNEAAF